METRRLEQVDPRHLTVDTNVRTMAELGTEFVASIKEHGVLVPVVAHEQGDGLRVLMGQRRTLAAVEAGLDAIPAYVVDTPEEADRIATQVVENDQRQRLNDRDRAEAFHQLALLGVTAAKIAKRTGASKTTVETALEARRNDTGTLALAAGLTLDQAATLAEFDDNPDAVDRLTEVATHNPGAFAHEARRLVKERDRVAAMAAVRRDLEADGKTVLDNDANALDITRLNRPDGEPATEDDADAYLVRMYYSHDEPTIVPVVAGWKAKGYTDRWDHGTGNGQRSGPMTEEEKAERRATIENNRAMDAANEVRREWLSALLGRKTAPKGHLAFTARTLARQPEEAAKAQSLAAELLGIDTSTYRPLSRHVDTAKSRHEFTILALAIAAYERSIDKTGWRNPGTDRRSYFVQLAAWGYSLSDVERTILPAPEEPAEA